MAQPDMEFFAAYCDNGETGVNFDRPGVKRLIEDAKAKKINVILCKDLSRFGRNYIEIGQFTDCLFDNAVAENFFSCLKCELVHLQHYNTRCAAQTSIFAYVKAFYNTARPHSALGWLPPSVFERRFKSIVAA